MRQLREYLRPSTAEEAVALKRRLGDRAAYVAGASDVMIHKPNVEALIDICHTGLDYVREEDGEYIIGGSALLRDAEVVLAALAGGMLREALRNTAPWLIRNAATVAGNIANASPAADSVPALMALDAQLILLGSGEERVDLQDVLLAPHKTSLGDRLIKEIRISRAAAGRSGRFIKLERSKSDIALVNVAVALRRDGDALHDVRIALGAVAPTAIRARQAESMLEGRAPTPEVLDEVQRAVEDEVRPIDDWRASAAYRRRMSGVLVRRAIMDALTETGNGEGT